VAAKTGTAQVFTLKKNQTYRKSQVAKHLRDHSLFIAFAPIENPQIAVAVVVENENTVAPGVARKVMDYYFSHNATMQENKPNTEAKLTKPTKLMKPTQPLAQAKPPASPTAKTEEIL